MGRVSSFSSVALGRCFAGRILGLVEKADSFWGKNSESASTIESGNQESGRRDHWRFIAGFKIGGTDSCPGRVVPYSRRLHSGRANCTTIRGEPIRFSTTLWRRDPFYAKEDPVNF